MCTQIQMINEKHWYTTLKALIKLKHLHWAMSSFIKKTKKNKSSEVDNNVCTASAAGNCCVATEMDIANNKNKTQPDTAKLRTGLQDIYLICHLALVASATHQQSTQTL